MFVEEVKSVLKQLFVQNEVAANAWLLQFQRSPQAWQVSNSILQLPYTTEEAYFQIFAAQTLRTKIEYYLQELPISDQVSLGGVLVIHIQRFTGANHQVLTQLCIALAIFLLRCPESGISIESVFQVSAQLPAWHETQLELLTVFAEEAMEERPEIRIPRERRKAFMAELLSLSSQVLRILEQQLYGGSEQIKGRAFHCLSCWVRLGCFQEWSGELILQHPLVVFTIQSLQLAERAEDASEILGELTGRQKGLPVLLLPHILRQSSAVLHSAITEENEEVVGGICSVLVEIAMAEPELFTSAANEAEAVALLESVLRCADMASSDWSICESTLCLWSSMADSSPPWLPSLSSVSHTLLNTLLRRAQASKGDTADQSTADALFPEGFLEFRELLKETLQDLCQWMGPDAFIALVLSDVHSWQQPETLKLLWDVVEVRLFALHAVSPLVTFDKIGAVGYEHLDAVMTFLAYLPQQTALVTAPHAQTLVAECACAVIGGYAWWIAARNPNALPAMLAVLLYGVKLGRGQAPRPLYRGRVCAAVRQVLESCCGGRAAMAGLSWQTVLPLLLLLHQELLPVALSPEEEADVALGMGAVLSACVQETGGGGGGEEEKRAAAMAVLQGLVGPAKQDMDAMLATTGVGPTHPRVTAGVRAFHRLATLCSQLSQSEEEKEGAEGTSGATGGVPSLGPWLLQTFWPITEQTLAAVAAGGRTGLAGSEALVDATCRCACQLASAAGPSASGTFPSLLSAMVAGFTAVPYAAYVKAVESLVRMHPGDDGGSFLEGAAAWAVGAVLQSPAGASLLSPAGCDSCPDVAEACMALSSAFLTASSAHVSSSPSWAPLVEGMLQRGLACCCGAHRGAGGAALSFLTVLLDAATMKPPSAAESSAVPVCSVTRSVCLKWGPQLVAAMLFALLGPQALTRVHKVSFVLQQLALLCFQTQQQEGAFLSSAPSGVATLDSWLQESLRMLPSGCLQPGEAESVTTVWGAALVRAAIEQSKKVDHSSARSSSGGYMSGEGGRKLKRCIHEFASAHRHIATC